MEKDLKDEKIPKPTVDPEHKDFLEEGFLSSEFVEELISELPSKPATPPPIPKKTVQPNTTDSRKAKSELNDRRRPGLYMELDNNAYSDQNLNEHHFNHLSEDLQALIQLFIDIPFVAAVADMSWQNPPNFSLQYTIIANHEEKDNFNAIFANKAFFNKEINFRALSVELNNLPKTLIENLNELMDIADIENLRLHIEEIIKKLLSTNTDSEVYQSILKEMESLPKGMSEKIKELVDLVKSIELKHGKEELCVVEFNYQTWRLLKKRKYKKLLQIILKELQHYR